MGFDRQTQIRSFDRLGQRMAERRKQLGLTQAQVARTLGMSRTKYAMMEVSGDALGSASFESVRRALMVLDLQLHLLDRPAPPTLRDIEENTRRANAERLAREVQSSQGADEPPEQGPRPR